jgi:hypothetical protein
MKDENGLEFGVNTELVRLIKMCLNETYSKHLSDSFPIQNGLKQGDALPPLLFNFVLEYAISKVEETQLGLKLKLLVYVYDVNLVGDNIDTIEKKAVTLTVASKEVGRNKQRKLHICCSLVTRMQIKVVT